MLSKIHKIFLIHLKFQQLPHHEDMFDLQDWKTIYASNDAKKNFNHVT